MGSINPQGGTRGGADIVGGGIGEGPGPDIMAAATLDGNKVMSSDDEHVGKISDIMLDVRGGRIAYAVLSEGGFLGMGSKLHAIPWNALTLDTAEKCFYVDIAAQRLKGDPGFDKDRWSSMADEALGNVNAQLLQPASSATRMVFILHDARGRGPGQRRH